MKDGFSTPEIYLQYEKNKQNCGRKNIELPVSEVDYINEKALQGWTPNVIIGRNEKPVSCSKSTLYRLFKSGVFRRANTNQMAIKKEEGNKTLNTALSIEIMNIRTIKIIRTSRSRYNRRAST